MHSMARNISNEASNKKKLSKLSSRYFELDEFKNSDHHRGYFCYNCIYFQKPAECVIVDNEGSDIFGKKSDKIAEHGICALWEPNYEEIHES